jgi:hypothetical protein
MLDLAEILAEAIEAHGPEPSIFERQPLEAPQISSCQVEVTGTAFSADVGDALDHYPAGYIGRK